LNGTQIGVLIEGPNNGLNAGDVFALAPPLVVTGENTIEFRQSVAGWTWGVTELGVLSAPPAGTAPVIALTLDDVDSGMYGHNYGTSEHETLLAATFTGDGTSIYYLQATGYDIDYNDEISVYLNGTQIGFLSKGANNGLNAGDLFTLLPHLSVAGQNTIEFRQRTVGWKWGVTGLGVLSVAPPGTPPVLALTLDSVDINTYGYKYGSSEHKTVLAAIFTGDGTSTYHLQVTGYDIDYANEISVWLNGTQIGFLAKGSNNGLNTGDLFTLSPTLHVAGPNSIEFRQRKPGWKWGVTNLGVLTSLP
jgi:hypothetical protein